MLSIQSLRTLFKGAPMTQNTLDDYIYGIIDVLKNYLSWNSYAGKNTLIKKHDEWGKLGIYKKNKCKKLKYQSIDSTIIRERYLSALKSIL